MPVAVLPSCFRDAVNVGMELLDGRRDGKQAVA